MFDAQRRDNLRATLARWRKLSAEDQRIVLDTLVKRNADLLPHIEASARDFVNAQTGVEARWARKVARSRLRDIVRSEIEAKANEERSKSHGRESGPTVAQSVAKADHKPERMRHDR